MIANANLGGHVSYRLPEQYLVGFFGAIGGIGSNANCCNGGAAFTHGTLGLEGQWYSGPITLYGQGGVQTNLSEATTAAITPLGSCAARAATTSAQSAC